MKCILINLFLFSIFIPSLVTAAYQLLEPTHSRNLISTQANITNSTSSTRSVILVSTDVETNITDPVKCRKLLPFDKTWFCEYPNIDYQDLALARAALWVEGNYGHPRHSVASHKSIALQKYRAGGHNRSSIDLQNFFKAAASYCSSPYHLDYCPSALEQELVEQLLKPLSLNGDFYLITSYTGESIHVKRHEVLHAHYYESSIYKKLINLFYYKVLSLNERDIINNYLRFEKGGPSLYNYYGNVPEVLVDEFQATALSSTHNSLPAAIKPFAKRLRDFLDKNSYSLSEFFK